MTKLCVTLGALLYCMLIVLALRPAFDLDVAATFYRGNGHFVGDTPVGIAVRYAAWALPFVVWAALMLAWIGMRIGLVAARWAPSSRGMLFLSLSLAIGPGLLVHGTLKEISHRPRPYAVSTFGGQETFRPFTKFDGACAHNCSFPSGETAAATWMLAPASLVPAPWTGLALGGATMFAVATALWRMAFGAHFLSDVSGAALITIFVVWATRALVTPRR